MIAIQAQTVKGAQSIYRVFQLMEYVFDNAAAGTTLAQASKSSGLNPTTAFRMLAALEDLGYVRKGDDDVYRPGFKPLVLAEKSLAALDVRTVARPVLERLSHRTKEVCHLVILDGLEAVYIDKVEDDSQSIRMNSRVGKRLPLHCTAVGKVLLAGMDAAALEEVLARLEFRKFTANTVTSPDVLRREIEEVRAKGIAFDRVEFEELIKCVAAPICGADGRVQAAVSISVPVMRFPEERERELADMLVKGCAEISRQLGYLR